jgi:hypothetical protein
MGNLMAGKVQIIDRGWNKIKRELAKAAAGAHARIGLLDGKGGDEAREGGLTNAQIGAVHEYGSAAAGIPERSFLRSTMTAKQEELVGEVARLIAQIAEGKMTVERALGILGARGVAEVQKTITTGDGVPPPNAPATIAHKGSSRPLVDTGRMVQSIAYDVKLRDEHGDGESGGHE